MGNTTRVIEECTIAQCAILAQFMTQATLVDAHFVRNILVVNNGELLVSESGILGVGTDIEMLERLDQLHKDGIHV